MEIPGASEEGRMFYSKKDNMMLNDVNEIFKFYNDV